MQYTRAHSADGGTRPRTSSAWHRRYGNSRSDTASCGTPFTPITRLRPALAHAGPPLKQSVAEHVVRSRAASGRPASRTPWRRRMSGRRPRKAADPHLQHPRTNGPGHRSWCAALPPCTALGTGAAADASCHARAATLRTCCQLCKLFTGRRVARAAGSAQLTSRILPAAERQRACGKLSVLNLWLSSPPGPPSSVKRSTTGTHHGLRA
jgi:hypothetical protein